MSAWIATDKHIASIVCRAYDTQPERQRIADLLKKANIRSVNYRYSERTKVTACDLSQAVDLNWKDVGMLATSLDYQSCELPTWRNSKACLELLRIRADAAFHLSDGGVWSI